MNSFTRTTAVAIVLAVGVFGSALAAERPNIVFILADDLGYGDLGCYGATDLSTPNLDRLADEGVKFTDFYANAPVCSPTRAALLSGRYQQRFGLDNALYYQEMGRGLPADGLTIADTLQAVGYRTGLSGKWHLGYDFERQPLQQGFDHFFGLLGGNHHYFKHMDRIGVPDLWLGNETIQRNGYTTDLITQDAIGFVRKHQSESFFLLVSHAAPHFPFQGPDDHDKVVEPKRKSWQLGDRETYIAMVERMDRGIGELVSEIDRLKLREKTLIVFTSDNGGDVHSRNAPFSGGKSSLQEGGIRVACLARWPETIAAGKTITTPAITMDWTATIRRLAGSKPVPSREDGIDLMPMIRGSSSEATDRPLFWKRKSGPVRKAKNPSRAVRKGDWKLFESLDGSGKRSLFNLKNDPGERNNVIEGHRDLAETLSAELDRWEESVYANLRPAE